MQNNKTHKIIGQILVLFVIILMTGCQKQKIKNHYTGNFVFTEIGTSLIYEGGPDDPYTYIDTLVSNGTIEWVEKTTSVKISYPNEAGYPIIYQVNVDKHGNLTLVVYDSNPPNPHLSRSFEGKFINDNEVNFTEHVSNNYMYMATTTTVVVGTRL
jgi:hypothetical protein